MYYLMIKTHAKTGLKYLCQTRRKNPYEYLGSGVYWKAHLEKHGPIVQTEIIGQYSTKQELKEAGIYYSNLYNVTESEEWANLRPEDGDGGDTSKTFGFVEGMKKRRTYIGEANPNYGKVGSWAGKVGPMIGKTWYNDGTKELLLDTKPDGWMDGRLKYTCEHCGKICNVINYKRWHNNNCKKKIISG
jgi:hypothetical protein